MIFSRLVNFPVLGIEVIISVLFINMIKRNQGWLKFLRQKMSFNTCHLLIHLLNAGTYRLPEEIDQ